MRSRRSTQKLALRMGFGVDIVGFGARSAPKRKDAQDRLDDLLGQVLDDLEAAPDETDSQSIGDGRKVFLPVGTQLQEALPTLLQAWKRCLNVDNERYRDRLRLKLSIAMGLVGLEAAGFSGQAVIELDRLLNCASLRNAIEQYTSADVVALLSNTLYDIVVTDEYPGLTAAEFVEVQTSVREYRRSAWLWTGRL